MSTMRVEPIDDNAVVWMLYLNDEQFVFITESQRDIMKAENKDATKMAIESAIRATPKFSNERIVPTHEDLDSVRKSVGGKPFKKSTIIRRHNVR